MLVLHQKLLVPSTGSADLLTPPLPRPSMWGVDQGAAVRLLRVRGNVYKQCSRGILRGRRDGEC